MPNIEQIILNGGVRLILVQDKNFKRNCASISFDVGRHTTSHKEFSALHILEHLILEGNDEYPSPQKQLFKNNSEVNGEVSNDTIRFWITAKDTEFYENLEILSSLILKPSLDDTRLEKEKKILTEELKEGLQSIEVVMNQMVEAALWPNSPFGQLEEEYESIQEVTLEDLEHINEVLGSDSKVAIVLAGTFEKGEVLNILGERWESIKVPSKIKQGQVELAKDLPTFSVIPVPFDQADIQIAFGYKKEPNDRRSVALGLLNTYLSHPGIGLFNTDLRDNKKLVYSIQSDLDLSRSKGQFVIDTKYNYQKAKEVAAAIFEAIDHLKKVGFRKGEFADLKNSYVAGLNEDAGDPEFWCYILGMAAMLDLNPTKEFNNYQDKILSLTEADVLKEAKNLFQHKNLAIVMVGPYEPKAVNEIRAYIEEVLGVALHPDPETKKYIAQSLGIRERIRSLFIKR